MRAVLSLAVVFSLLFGCGGKPGQSEDSTPPVESFRIINRDTGLQLGRRPGAPQWEQESSSYWKAEKTGSFFKLRNQCTEDLLALSEESMKNGGGTCQLLDEEGAAVFWKIEPAGDGFWRIVNKDTEKCLDSHKNGKRKSVGQSAVSAKDTAQQWRLETDVQAEEKKLAEQRASVHLDCGHLTTGEEGVIACEMTILRVFDDQSCLVLPRDFWTVTNASGGGDLTATVEPPLILKKYPTRDFVTGQKFYAGKQIFRVTGTADDGRGVRVHVVEAIP